MGIVSGIVLFAVVWFMVLFVVLPIRIETQGDRGEVEPGTPQSAPAEAVMWRKAKQVTAISFVIWAILAAIILSGAISLRDLDWFRRPGS